MVTVLQWLVCYPGRCVTLVCEWQLSCFKLPIDLVSHGLAHGPWREAFVCSQPCTLPICCWDGLQCCHQPHQQQEDLCFLCFPKNAKSCSKLLQITPRSTSQPFNAVCNYRWNMPVQIRGIYEFRSNCPLLNKDFGILEILRNCVSLHENGNVSTVRWLIYW